ncbi:type II toxin-antitoxin system VapC family toxin [Streptomyces sp. NPDC088400]|uniref:type II toxin-antitoxin system VapC family toxin n=1 Tax=Streptomyces sp. NPDC088400 TaxID=3365861 RepID=UPI00382D33DF
MLIVDTGPVVALLNRNDKDHESCAELLESHDGELLITPYVLTEACYLLAKYVSPDAEINLVEAVAAGELIQVATEGADLSRMTELMRQYRGFPLGIGDASAITEASPMPR